MLLSLLPQGVTCILPVLREGVLTGTPEQKEEAAKALGAVIKLTSPEALRPSVINITGPLIRILGDRFAWTVKTALLETLTLLLAKVCTRIENVNGQIHFKTPSLSVGCLSLSVGL